ncbi:substrate-binding domain-containing protein [Fusibacter bizertensis]|uniref:Substrate-binding domain-containing protein n=1 Tax=Fusibacter bizertensis TaxID=1488331 RepID=A0ABT6NA25_9FIRM|nr:substrate-binding domain-containing protein [Fusibacter bizertensis]MDH8677261.1 substrate-binding domain-containing protein [Fusibacter bizertensis]
MKHGRIVKVSFMRLIAFICIMTMTFTLSGCIDKDKAEKRDKIMIGLSLDSIVVERWQRELEILVATVNELGAELNVQIANESIDKQTEQIQYLIDQQVDVLIIVPNDAKAFYDVISEAERNDIDVIAYDRLIMHPDVDLYVSFDNVEIGRGITKRLIDEFRKNELDTSDESFKPYNLLIINGDPKDNNSKLLNEGIYAAIQEYIDAGFVNVLDETWANEWREQVAKDLVEENLSKGERIDGIIAANDVLATGAIEILSKWRKAGEVLVVSQDAELSACQRIVEKTQLATAYKPIYDLASTTAKIAVSMAKGEKIIANDSIYNNYDNIPYLKLDAYVVDLDNMESVVIKSGFHRKEDIYRNINDGQ